MIYLFNRIIRNNNRWIKPSTGRLGRYGEGEYVSENGYGYEDWNFNKGLAIDEYIYGFCYYRPAKEKKGETFNIAFAKYENEQWFIVGVYLNTTFVENPPTKNRILEKKYGDLINLGSSLGTRWRRMSKSDFIRNLRSEVQYTNYKVHVDNVILATYSVPIPKSVFETKNYRITKPTLINEVTFRKLQDLVFKSMLLEKPKTVEEEFPEGRLIEIKHKAKERDSRVVQVAKQEFKNKHGRLFCQICDFDFSHKYGDIGDDFIEAHHTVPVAEIKGIHRTKPSEIAMVCANCHRMLHRKRPWLRMAQLKKLLRRD